MTAHLCPIWIVDAKSFAILDANDAACALLECSRETLLARSALEFLNARSRRKLRMYRSFALANWGEGGKLEAFTLAGVPFEMDIRFHVMERPTGLAFFVLPTRVTERAAPAPSKPVSSVKTTLKARFVANSQ